jgi:hypothetical protein
MVVSLTSPNILQPNTSVAPLEGQDLNRFFQIWLVGLSGLDPTLVRPERQDEPPNIPDAGQAWCSFNWDRISSDTFPFIGFKTGGGNTFRDLQRHEMLVLNADFLDLGTNGLASFYTALVRDNLIIDDNVAYLQSNGFNLRSASDIEILPVIFKSRWKYRERLPIYIKRNVERQYNTLQTQQASVAIQVDGLFVTGFPSSNIPPFTPFVPPFNPTLISGIVLWFDASNASTIISSAGSVSQWNDESGNANNLTQSTGSARFTIQSAALNGLNTLLAASANSQFMNLTNPITNGPFSEFMVTRVMATGFQRIVWAGNSGASGGPSNTVISGNQMFVASSDGNFVFSGANSFPDTTSYHLISTVSDGNNNDTLAFYDRAPVSFTGSGSGTLAALNAFGKDTSSGLTDGAIAEYIRYNAALTTAQRQQVENYLRNKWATP